VAHFVLYSLGSVPQVSYSRAFVGRTSICIRHFWRVQVMAPSLSPNPTTRRGLVPT